jgi:hypothetical protein
MRIDEERIVLTARTNTRRTIGWLRRTSLKEAWTLQSRGIIIFDWLGGLLLSPDRPVINTFRHGNRLLDNSNANQPATALEGPATRVYYDYISMPIARPYKVKGELLELGVFTFLSLFLSIILACAHASLRRRSSNKKKIFKIIVTELLTALPISHILTLLCLRVDRRSWLKTPQSRRKIFVNLARDLVARQGIVTPKAAATGGPGGITR